MMVGLGLRVRRSGAAGREQHRQGEQKQRSFHRSSLRWMKAEGWGKLNAGFKNSAVWKVQTVVVQAFHCRLKRTAFRNQVPAEGTFICWE